MSLVTETQWTHIRQ